MNYPSQNVRANAVNLSATDFVLAFEVKDQPVLFQEFICKYYFPDGGVYTTTNGTCRSFVSKESVRKITEAGKQFFSRLEPITEATVRLEKKFSELETVRPQWRMADTLSSSDVSDTLTKAQDIHRIYSLFYTSHIDGAYLLDDKFQHKHQLLALLDEKKNTLRERYNRIFFAPDGFYHAFLPKVAQSFGENTNDAQWYQSEEMRGLSSGKKVSSALLKARAEAYAFTRFDNKITFFEGEVAVRFIAQFNVAKERSFDEVKGTIANKGKARGRVKVVNSDYTNFDTTRRAMAEMKKGDVLVSITTAPELMEACNKASAIVTDLGGLLSHAAIVSREIGIPCVVGTQYASKIFKDGDMVEVDAEKGTVRKL